jgi:hypothetical protein
MVKTRLADADGGGRRLAVAAVLTLVAVTGIAAVSNGPGRIASGATATRATSGSAAQDRPALRDLIAALTRTGIGPDLVAIDLTYAPPIFFDVTGLQPPPEAGTRPTLAFMLQETVHDGAVSGAPPSVFQISEAGARISPYDVRVTASDPHHRTTRLLFPGAEGSTAAADEPAILTLVIPRSDGSVSEANTFEWRLPIVFGGVVSQFEEVVS